MDPTRHHRVELRPPRTLRIISKLSEDCRLTIDLREPSTNICELSFFDRQARQSADRRQILYPRQLLCGRTDAALQIVSRRLHLRIEVFAQHALSSCQACCLCSCEMVRDICKLLLRIDGINSWYLARECDVSVLGQQPRQVID